MKFGFSQIGKRSPESLVKFIDAIIIFVMPSFAAFVVSIPEIYLSHNLKILIGSTSTFAIGILKALQYMFGKTDQTLFDK